MDFTKLRDSLLKFTDGKIDVINQDGSYKSFGQVIESMAELWPDFTEETQKDISKLMAGEEKVG